MSSFNKVRVKNKRDTAANWERNNPVLLNGELIIVDTNVGDVRFKIGDGTKTYTQLPFQDESVYSALSGKADESHDHNDQYFTKEEINSFEFITPSDIDAICGRTVEYAENVEF